MQFIAATERQRNDYLSLSKREMMKYCQNYRLPWNDEERRRISHEGNLFVIVDKQVIGFILLCDHGATRKIYDFQVMEAFRNQGYGGRALLEVERQARHDGIENLFLMVFKSNPAKRLYERHGFHIIFEAEVSYKMSKDLMLDGLSEDI